MRRKIAVAALILASACFAAATDLDECFELNRYFNKSPSVINSKIAEYEDKLQADQDDYYCNLAIGILYCALSSPMDDPEPGASSKAVDAIKRFEKRDRKNALAKIYLGLGRSLKSRDSKNPLTQLSEVKSAFSEFDKAVSLASGTELEWYARYMRGNFLMNVPESFKKRKIAEADAAFALTAYEKDPSLESCMAVTFYYLGEIERSRGNLAEAIAFWERSVEVDGKYSLSSPEARKAAKQLSLLGGSR